MKIERTLVHCRGIKVEGHERTKLLAKLLGARVSIRCFTKHDDFPRDELIIK